MKIDQQLDYLRVYFSDHFTNNNNITDSSNNNNTSTSTSTITIDKVIYSDFHYFWLRHNCQCIPHCKHPLTKERIIDSSEISLSIQPKEITILSKNGNDDDNENSTSTNTSSDNNNILKIIWNTNDNHITELSERFLFENKYSINRLNEIKVLNDLSLVEMDYQHKDANNDNEFILECLQRVKRDGCVIVRYYGTETEQLINQFEQYLEIIPTHFGRIEDLKTNNTTNKNTDQLGYTNSAVDLHTDQPFIENPPQLQLLQCLQPSQEGGDNYIVNAKQVALYLKRINPLAFHLLTSVKVKFHRKQLQFESIQYRPIIELYTDNDKYGNDNNNDKYSDRNYNNEEENEIKQLRFSYFTYAPHQIDFYLMKEYYNAYNLFTNLCRDKQFQIYFKLNRSDFVLYDNYLMFHARTAFSGERWLRGIYFNYKK
ncbi:hypothetical protein ABK040_006245 [Willaertia magna]